MPSPLERALTAPGPRPLPSAAARLLAEASAPPRLAAHLRAVHDAAADLLDLLAAAVPDLAPDTEAVLFGAATHDIGKALHPSELTGPGSRHEEEGYRLLRSLDVPERLARFARTHGTWDAPDRTVEDLLVSLADTLWKGRRAHALEERVIDRAVEAAPAPDAVRWTVLIEVDGACERVAADAESRLTFQNTFPPA